MTVRSPRLSSLFGFAGVSAALLLCAAIAGPAVGQGPDSAPPWIIMSKMPLIYRSPAPRPEESAPGPKPAGVYGTAKVPLRGSISGPGAEKALKGFYQSLGFLMHNRDFRGLARFCDRMLTPDWTATDTAGESHSRYVLLYLIRGGPSEYQRRTAPVVNNQGRYDAIVKTVNIQDGTATVDWVLESTRLEADADGKWGAKGSRHRLTRRESVRDSWVWQDGWKLQHTRTLSITLDIDGKPTKHVPRAGLFVPPFTAAVFSL
jgi:hypothetical protein